MFDPVVVQNLTLPTPMIATVSRLLTGGGATEWRDCDPFDPRDAMFLPIRELMIPDVTFDGYRGM